MKNRKYATGDMMSINVRCGNCKHEEQIDISRIGACIGCRCFASESNRCHCPPPYIECKWECSSCKARNAAQFCYSMLGRLIDCLDNNDIT